MNVQLRSKDIKARTVPAAQDEVMPDWRAAAGLVIAGLLTFIWIGFLLWLPGYALGFW